MAGTVVVDDELWAVIEPLIPRVRRRRVRPGRRRLDDRAVLNGILFVLHTGIAWRLLPQQLGFGSGVTCWRRLREWQAAGVWERVHDELLIASIGPARSTGSARSSIPATRALWGARHRALPRRSRPRGQQASRLDRRQRAAAGGLGNRRQPQ